MYVDLAVSPVMEPKKRHSEPYTEYQLPLCQNLCVPSSTVIAPNMNANGISHSGNNNNNISLHCLSVPDLSASPHQLFREFCSDVSPGVAQLSLDQQQQALTPPNRSPASSTSGSPNRISRNRVKYQKGRRRSLGVPGSRSPNGRSLWKELEEDPWAEFHRKRSPGLATARYPQQAVDPPPGPGAYRCRSFSVTPKGNILNLGDVVLTNALDERRKSVSSCTDAPEDPSPPLVRVRLLGAPGVGKSCLLQQFIEGRANTVNEEGHLEIITSPPPSAENSVDVQTTRVMLDGEEFDAEFDETTDHVVTKQHLEEADAFVVVYSVTDRESLELAEDTISQLRVLCGHQKGGGVGRRRSSATATLGGLLNRPITKAVILAANKADLARKRCVSTEEGRSLAKKYECKFIETSACIGHNVDELLVGTLKQIRLKQRSGSVPAWCTLDVPPIIRSRAASLSPEPTPGHGYGHRASLSTSAFPPIMTDSAEGHRPSVARSIACKARGFINKFWTKCDSVRTRSCDDLHVL
ncbi:GTP-binding protein REM 2-like [Varroa jacobsoni]|uniref:GTP-binding protein REM 2-like n=1 Tax=Varroa jacobsoni TaxID=62625 RepID=UPI000BF52215|nr:GTP-binding protein REM 2-like [Varroa jacobsoni]XP_022705943.1 GTP-binding protein REM 2-like [Varroa jacobsoni]XP_022705944.1 GTP-binding protein REM 2-like [Varroa jacobsoni]